MPTKLSAASALLLAWTSLGPVSAEAQSEATKPIFTVSIDRPENGTISVTPPLPENGRVPEGTILTVTATPARGYSLDSGYYYLPVGFLGNADYRESFTETFQFVVNWNWKIGASFIESKALEGFKVTQDVFYARPGVKTLKYDVYSPTGATNLPCIVILPHNGSEDQGRGLARELVRGGRYVVFSVDYRAWDIRDGDGIPNRTPNLIEDVYGAIAHLQEHAKEYGADPSRIALTGEYRGGELAAAAIVLVDQIGEGGFEIKEGIYQFKPSYLPKGKTVEQVRKEITAALKAAAPCSASLGTERGAQSITGVSEAFIKAVSPQDHIPHEKDRAVPQYLLVARQRLFEPPSEIVRPYANALKAAGQRVEYEEVLDGPLQIFPWSPSKQTKATFARFGVPYAAKIKAFFDTVFYPK